MRCFLLVFCLQICVLQGADYDCIVVGTSPIALFEALYQHDSGKSVLIIDEGCRCGGAWQAIDICGVEHVDLGCHQITTQDAMLREFLEVYAGCDLVFIDQPELRYDRSMASSGFYFAQGCHELIRRLEERISHTSIELLLNHRIERVSVDLAQQHLTLDSQNTQLTAKKMVCGSCAYVPVEGQVAPLPPKTKYYHLYLLIADPSPPRFSYRNYSGDGASRMMNLTHFVGLAHTGQQLIALQTHSAEQWKHSEKFLEALKQQKLIDPSAHILCEESYLYEQWPCQASFVNRLPREQQSFFEILDTTMLASMLTHISKWKQALKPYRRVQ